MGIVIGAAVGSAAVVGFGITPPEIAVQIAIGMIAGWAATRVSDAVNRHMR